MAHPYYAHWILCGFFTLCLSSCGALKSVGGGGQAEKDGNQDAFDGRRGWALALPELAGGAGGTSGGVPAGGTTAMGGGMFDFSSVVGSSFNSSGVVPWQVSGSQGVEQSKAKSKPAIFLFTQANNEAAQDMERTLLISPAFRELVVERCVLVRMDFANDSVRRSAYYQNLKSRFKVGGFPSLVMTLPDGKEIFSRRGYSKEGQAGYLEALKGALERGEKTLVERRKKMEPHGYRYWSDREGSRVFAKLTAVDANVATFRSEWGLVFTKFLTRLSDEDQMWVELRSEFATRS